MLIAFFYIYHSYPWIILPIDIRIWVYVIQHAKYFDRMLIKKFPIVNRNETEKCKISTYARLCSVVGNRSDDFA